MAARLRKNHQDDVRLKIKVSQIINRLQDNLEGLIELNSGQIQSAKILLDKSMSNAPTITDNQTELSGTVNHIVAKRPKLTREEWLATLAK